MSTNDSISKQAENPSSEDEMARFNIRKTLVPYYTYKEYRYTDLKDAIAQAKRDGKQRSS